MRKKCLCGNKIYTMGLCRVCYHEEARIRANRIAYKAYVEDYWKQEALEVAREKRQENFEKNRNPTSLEKLTGIPLCPDCGTLMYIHTENIFLCPMCGKKVWKPNVKKTPPEKIITKKQFIQEEIYAPTRERQYAQPGDYMCGSCGHEVKITVGRNLLNIQCPKCHSSCRRM